ncbi:uncharacterized protein LOC123273258 isoform X1 [Cotesia glomerata]|uniref:Uncharacterized protein n=1 Tax=Cotesia glomerata TaxID=32391 RepID=A0AAV7J3M9_COTGL|nr:uncharacterized protein LOC123273258 isoform X1 [Cotesia glomerata]XP_044596567.1 uncharacterized protein LOC123273258 isoform X1 [Cotesia glomerata]XP_044596568.1 uncharacterized protein LOC123273258 isoform X1 [Cotesia glomerata]KAH0563974.1 hypothetical protein KQX54_008454 [Cotesia glomerata]
MFGKLLVLLLVANVDKHVLSKPTSTTETVELTLETPKEIINSTIIKVPNRWDRGMELLGQIMDSLRFGRGRFVNFVMMARNEIAERAEEFTSETANKLVSLLAARDARKIIQNKTEKRNAISPRSETITTVSTPIKIGPLDSFLPAKTRETSRLESETGQSLFEFKKPKPVQGFLENLLSPVPLVDRIREEDKYGNTGDKFIGIGRALIKGFEGFSNFLNTIVDLPVDAAKKTSRGITAALNQIGGKLVGLE